MDVAERFFNRFSGLGHAHGRYTVGAADVPDDRGKLTGRAATVAGPLTLAEVRRHLDPDGQTGVGAVPIRDDGTCVFGAIDVDVYPLDLPKLERRTVELGLPLTLCRTKSGGGHLYVFFKEPVPATLLREKLVAWAAALGHAGVEIFPKQITIDEECKGSWINLPYQAGPRTLRYALLRGQGVSLEEFLDHADRVALTLDELTQLEARVDPDLVDAFHEAPPCLQTLGASLFPQGSRNNGLFSLGVYLKKRFPDDWQQKVADYAARYFETPLPGNEVGAIVKSLEKKGYSYRCKDIPLNSCCDRKTCLKREFGVSPGASQSDVNFGELVKLETKPPTWQWMINNLVIELSTEELLNQRLFQTRCVDVLNYQPVTLKAAVWNNVVNEHLANVRVVEVPEDATKEGQLWVHLHRFCTSRVKGRNLDELLLGKPWPDPETGRTYFCASDLMAYLQTHRFNVTERDLYKWLRDRGVQSHRKTIKGKDLRYWSVPSFTEQTEPHEVPRGPAVEKM